MGGRRREFRDFSTFYNYKITIVLMGERYNSTIA
jgi:hypothetical protein